MNSSRTLKTLTDSNAAQFTPTLNQNVGDKTAYLTLTHSAGSQLVTLTGTTTMPAQTIASVNPASLTLTTPPQTPSVEGIFTLNNTGSSPLMFYAGAASLQGVNASLFTLLPSSTCLSSAGVNVPVGKSCTLAVQFKPSAAVIPNTVYFASLILNLNTPSPLKIPLSGKVNNTPQVYYIHPDHLNTPRMITDVGGKVVWQWENTEPFGNNTPNQNPSGLGTFEYNPRFPGQYFDKETGLNYNGFRDYDPAIGRYVESDPIGLAGGVNTYGYVNNDPLRGGDPWGLQTCVLVTTHWGFGTHAALYISRIRRNEKDKYTTPAIYDPSGNYSGASEGNIVYGDVADIEKFRKYHKDKDKDKTNTVCKDTTEQEEQELFERAVAEGVQSGFFCAISVSNVLAGSAKFPSVKGTTVFPNSLFGASQK